MPSPGHQLAWRYQGTPEEGVSGAASSCLRWFSFLSNIFDTEMSLEEELVWQLLRRFANVPFDRGNPNHEGLLHTLYVLCFPDASKEPIKEEDPRWKEIGFQSADPRRDFRGGGLLALQNLCFFRTHYPEAFASLAAKSLRAGFPMAAALINVTHMLAGYFRLTESIGLGSGEPLASRRVFRRFARLCLSDDDEGLEAIDSAHADAFRDTNRLSCPAPTAPCETPFSDSELPQAAAATRARPAASKYLSPRRQASKGSSSVGCPGTRSASSHQPRGLRRERHLSNRRGRGQYRGPTDDRILNAFGRLYVYSCLRLEQELESRGAWEPDGANPPLLKPTHGSPLHAFRRFSESRRNSADHISSPRSHCGNHLRPSFLAGNARHRPPSPASSPRQPTQLQERAKAKPREALDSSCADKPVVTSSSRSTVGPEETCCPPTSVHPSPSHTPRCITSPPAEDADRGGASGSQHRPSEEEEGQPVHRRAHLVFGVALKEVRSAVDAVLSCGIVHKIEDLEAICKGC